MKKLIPKIFVIYQKIDEFRFERASVYSWTKIVSAHISIYFLGASLMVVGVDVMLSSDDVYAKEMASSGSAVDAYYYNRLFVYTAFVVFSVGAIV